LATDHTNSNPDLGLLGADLLLHLDEVVDGRLLVLQGLRQAGLESALTPAELLACTHNEALLRQACEDHPGLASEVQAVERELALFEQVWPIGPVLPARPRTERAAVASPRARKPLVRWPARIGLGVSALVLGFLMVTSLFDSVQRTTVSADTTPLVVELGDGSTARLTAGSSLTYVEGSTFDRNVDLKGAAYFDVQPGTRRFSVITRTAVTSVLGTRFGVLESAEGTEVVLVSGSVAVASRASRESVVILEPGERTMVSAGSAPEPPRAVQIEAAMPWLDLLIFRDTPMAQVVLALGDARGARVDLGVGLADLTVSGTFRVNQTAEEILSILAATLEADLERSAQGFTLTLR
jgi:transmembrane sensor